MCSMAKWPPSEKKTLGKSELISTKLTNFSKNMFFMDKMSITYWKLTGTEKLSGSSLSVFRGSSPIVIQLYMLGQWSCNEL